MKPTTTATATESPSRNTEVVADSLKAMIQREFSPFSCSYYDGYLDPTDPTMITAEDREKIVNWCYGLVEYYHFSTETVASAMDMVDRFLSMPSNSTHAAKVCDEALRDRCKFQLLTIAALYSSVKINEREALSSQVLSDMCCHRYTPDEIERMEHTLLCGLSWRCNTPTAQQVGLSILSLAQPHIDIPRKTWDFIVDEMTYLNELAVYDYFLSTQRASTIALAAISNVMNDTSTKEYQELFTAILTDVMECFEIDHSEQIDAARRRLRSFAEAADIDSVDDVALG